MPKAIFLEGLPTWVTEANIILTAERNESRIQAEVLSISMSSYFQNIN